MKTLLLTLTLLFCAPVHGDTNSEAFKAYQARLKARKVAALQIRATNYRSRQVYNSELYLRYLTANQRLALARRGLTSCKRGARGPNRRSR